MQTRNTLYSIPEYTGRHIFKTSWISRELYFTIYFLIILIYYLNDKITSLNIVGENLYPWFIIIYVSIMLFFFLGVYLTPLDKLKVNKDGAGLAPFLKKMDKFFKWDDIREIGISPSPAQKSSIKRYIYISLREQREDVYITWHTESKDLIVLKYRPKVIHCILKYWDKEIRNLEAMKSWKRYIDKL